MEQYLDLARAGQPLSDKEQDGTPPANLIKHNLELNMGLAPSIAIWGSPGRDRTRKLNLIQLGSTHGTPPGIPPLIILKFWLCSRFGSPSY